MISKATLSAAWTEFLESIDSVRNSLHCSRSAAWFRGQRDCWPLKPSLLRHGISEDPEDGSEAGRQEQEIEREKLRGKQLLREKTRLKGELGKDHNSLTLRKRYRKMDAGFRISKDRVAGLKKTLARLRVPINGERELFDEFVVRAGKLHSVPSWEILAEMRHHGVPTRLIDWTDRLDIALYFALEGYREVVTPGMSAQEAVHKAEELPSPCIWVLNPFFLSRRSTGRTAIWSFSHEPDYDYYTRILRQRNWPFDEPVPIYPPANFERIRSQRGYFTVLGNSKDPVDLQLRGGMRCLDKVIVTPAAGIFCLDYLTRVQGLSRYEVYRDLDSLGLELAERLARIQAPKSAGCSPTIALHRTPDAGR